LIVVLASDADVQAKALVARWSVYGARLMTPTDLSCSGWVCEIPEVSQTHCVIDNLVCDPCAISGILVRTTHFAADELMQIAVADRCYIAAEINAFLIYWLATIGRPVLNRPSARCLSGPGWYPENWMQQAGLVGLQVRPATRRVGPDGFGTLGQSASTKQGVDLTIVGDSCFGVVATELRSKARALADRAGLDLVRFRFDGSGADAHLVEADPFPLLTDPAVEHAVLAIFGRP
jgi:hypothetical protein